MLAPFIACTATKVPRPIGLRYCYFRSERLAWTGFAGRPSAPESSETANWMPADGPGRRSDEMRKAWVPAMVAVALIAAGGAWFAGRERASAEGPAPAPPPVPVVSG